MNSKSLCTVIILSVFLGITSNLFACSDPPEAVITPALAVTGMLDFYLSPDENGDYYAVVYSDTADDNVFIDGSYSADAPPGGPLTYAWDINDNGYSSGSGSTLNGWQPTEGVYTIKLRVTSTYSGLSDIDTVRIIVGPRRVERTISETTKTVSYSYIQHAIDQAGNGDEITANEGIYVENIDFNGEDITVKSESPDNPANTVIVGDGINPVVSFNGEEGKGTNECQLSGFTITDDLPDNGLVANWKLDNNAENSVGNDNGTLLPAGSEPTWDPFGYIDEAIKLDGINDYVELPHVLNPGNNTNNAFSAFAWVKGGGFSQKILDQDDGSVAETGQVWLQTNYLGELVTWLKVSDGGNLASTYTGHNDGNWHHVGVVWDGKRRHLYADGVKVASDPTDYTVSLIPCDGIMYIGSYRGTSNFWDGLIDDVRIYNRALDEDVINKLALSRVAPNPVLYLKLNGNITDSSPLEDTSVQLHDNVPEWESQGKINDALKLDGAETYITSNSVLDPSETAFSAFVWVKHVATGTTYDKIFAQEDGGGTGSIWLQTNYLGQLSSQLNTNLSGNLVSTYTDHTDGNWHHVGFVWDGKRRYIYADGVVVKSDTDELTGSIGSCTGNLRIGVDLASTEDRFWDGLMDEVRIYDKALSNAEVIRLYETTSDRFVYSGGGIYSDVSADSSGTNATISNCIITGNKAENGGGIYDCDGEISNCTITNNTADAEGGGLANCDGTIINCVIAANTAGNGGGLDSCKAAITNCTIADNAAKDKCGGIRIETGENPAITNCIVWGNTDQVTVPNIEEAQIFGGSPNVSYSCIQSWTSGGTGGANNIDDDPRFVDADGADDDASTADDNDYRLAWDSLCLDAGDNSSVPIAITTDILAYSRIFDVPHINGTVPTVDMGAFELTTNNGDVFVPFLKDDEGNAKSHQEILDEFNATDLELGSITSVRDYSPSADPAGTLTYSNVSPGQLVPAGTSIDLQVLNVWFVDAANSTSYLGASWDTAYKDLWTVLDMIDSMMGDTSLKNAEIWVAKGTYKPDLNSSDRTDTFQLIDKVKMYGGFTGSEVLRSQRNWKLNETILSGDISILNDNTDNSFHVVTGSGVSTASVLDGFTITRGHAHSAQQSKCDGAGMYNDSGSPTVNNCKFIENVGSSETSRGAGVFNINGSAPVFFNCLFTKNVAYRYGGGMFNIDSDTTLLDCTFLNNESKIGGGIHNGLSNTIITQCKFIGNSAGQSGGGISEIGCSSTITDSVFNGNFASEGGGYYETNSYYGNINTSNIIDCVFSNNIATDDGGGAICYSGTPTFTNCTFSNNYADDGGGIYVYNATVTLSNCIVWSNYNNSENVNQTENNISIGFGSMTISDSCIQGCGGSYGWDSSFGTDGGGNIDIDPQFANAYNPLGPDGIFGTEDDGLISTICVLDFSDDDWDGDGIPNDVEMAYGVNPGVYDDGLDLNPYDNDTDHDGVTDSEELNFGMSGVGNFVYVLGENMNPLKDDTDDDGMPDGWEYKYWQQQQDSSISPVEPDPGTNDTDNDGLCNLGEYKIKEEESIEKNYITEYYSEDGSSNPLDSNTDNDGLLDGDEITYDVSTEEFGQPQSRLGGISGDINNISWYTYSYYTSPINPDTDGDGLIDNSNNIAVQGSDFIGCEENWPSGLYVQKDGYFIGDWMPTYSDVDILTSDSGAMGDGFSDGWEIRYSPYASLNYFGLFYRVPPNLLLYSSELGGAEPISGVENAGAADDDPDGDLLTNIQEYQNNTNPNEEDTDNDGINDGVEVADPDLNPLNPDSDGDGWRDGDDIDPADWDVDKDLLPDGWEHENGMTPSSDNTDGVYDTSNKNPDGSCKDSDGDGLDDFEELKHGTNPAVPLNEDTNSDGEPDVANPTIDGDGNGRPDGQDATDTDGDTVSDFDEVEQGSNPNNGEDNGAAPDPDEVVVLGLEVGDPSGSHSERYTLKVTCKSGTGVSINHRSPDFGVVGYEEYNGFLKGDYEVEICHEATNIVGGDPDYDYRAYIYPVSVPSNLQLIIDDSQGILGDHNESNPFFAKGKKAAFSIVNRKEGDPAALIISPKQEIENRPKGGDPVNLDNGEYTYDCTDLIVKGHALDVVLRRYYRSSNIESTKYGNGWDMSFNINLEEDLENSMLVLHTGRNGTRNYTYNSENLRYEDFMNPGNYIEDEGYAFGDYKLTESSGKVSYFDQNGITRVEDRFGNATVFNYYGGVLDYITNDVGRQIHVDYDQGLLKYVTLVIDGGENRVWEYLYYDGVEGGGLYGDLKKVIAPITTQDVDPLSWTYTYDNDHRLLTITDAKGQTFLKNKYDSEGKVIFQINGEELPDIPQVEGDTPRDGEYAFEYSPRTSRTQVTDRKGYKTVKTYSDCKKLLAETVYNFDQTKYYTTYYEYEMEGLHLTQLKRIVTPGGNCAEFTYDEYNNIKSVHSKPPKNIGGDWLDNDDPSVISTYLEYVEGQTDFFKQCLVRQSIDELGNETDFKYDFDDFATYGTNIGLLREIILPEVEVYGQATLPRPTIEFDYYTNQSTVTYGKLKTMTLRDGTVIEYIYYTNAADINNYGRLYQIIVDSDPTNGLNIITEYVYDENGHATIVTLDKGAGRLNIQTDYIYDELGRLEQILAPQFGTERYVTELKYDENSQLSEIGSQLGIGLNEIMQTTTFQYDILDQLKMSIDALQRKTVYDYDKNDNLEYVTDAESESLGSPYKTKLGYDERGLNTSVLEANNALTQYDYDNNGNLISVTDAENQITFYDYDKFNRLEKTTYLHDNSGTKSTEEYSYDMASNLTTFKTRSGDMIHYQYDALGNLVAEAVDILDDSSDFVVEAKLAAGEQSIKEWYLRTDGGYGVDSDYFVNSSWITADYHTFDTQTLLPSGQYMVLCYWPEGATANNVQIDVSYSGLTDTVHVNQAANNGRWVAIGTYEFDGTSSGQVTIHNQGEGLSTYIDAVRFVPAQRYWYDIAGRLVEVMDPAGKSTFFDNTQDRLGRVTTVTDQNNRDVGYEYDNLDKITKITYPGDASIPAGSFDYQYDSMGRLEYIYIDQNVNDQFDGTPTDTLIAQYAYDELSRPTSVSYGNGTSISYDYEDYNTDDNLGNTLEAVNNTIGANYINYAYQYDKVDNRKNMTISSSYAYLDHYQYPYTYNYDNIYQLEDVEQDSSAVFDYTYDFVGNRLTSMEIMPLSTDTIAYSINNLINQYSGLTINSAPVTPFYDDNQNMTYDGYFNYIYDAENQLVEVKDAAGTATVATYTYDYAGRRLSKTVYDSLTVETVYLYDGDQVIAEYDDHATQGTLALVRRFVYGPGIDRPVAMIDLTGASPEWYYYHHDALGNVIALSNSSGAIAESYEYTPYGTVTIYSDMGGDITATGSAIANSYMFTARRFDEESGLYYYRARMYSPQLGRFMQTDPIGYADSMNLYLYGLNSPTNWIDPYGLSATSRFLESVIGGINRFENTGFADYTNDVRHMLHGEALGVADVGRGLYDTARHPIQAAKGTIDAIAHPIDTLKAIGSGLVCKGKALMGDDYLAAGRVVGQAAGTAAVTAIGAKTGGYLKGKAGKFFQKPRCFVEGTEILTPYGVIPIEDIKVGDIVWAWDTEEKEVVFREVLNTVVRQTDSLVIVEVGDEVIETTSEHPFWVIGSGWLEAKKLKLGHLLMDVDGNYIPVDKVKLEDRPTTVYNFEVADEHNYFVSNEYVLVHNNTCAAGRLGRQPRLRELMNDPKVSKADRGWLRQEYNSVRRGQRRPLRVPPGKNLAHRRGFEARKGYGYEFSDLQNIKDHLIQHRFEGYR